MANDRVLLITGPAGAGKSTVAAEWASNSREPCAHLSLDTFREMLKSGFLHTRDGWNDETQRQLDLARDNVASVAKNFVGAGISVVIDDVVFPRWEVSGIDRWRSALSPIEADLVVLFPSWQVVAERNSGRSGHKLLPDEMLRQIFDDMGGWQDQTAVDVIDNSFLSAAEAVKAIAQGVMPRQQEEAE